MLERPDWTEVDRRRYKALVRMAEALVDLLATFERHEPETPRAPAPRPGRLLTVKEASELLGISRGRIYELIHRTDGLGIPHIRLGERTFRILETALQEWLARDGREVLAKREAESARYRPHRR